MDLFDFDKIMELARLEPGHGLLQSLLLFMIWVQSRGVRKELSSLGAMFKMKSVTDESRFSKLESRVTTLEQTKGGLDATSTT